MSLPVIFFSSRSRQASLHDPPLLLAAPLPPLPLPCRRLLRRQPAVAAAAPPPSSSAAAGSRSGADDSLSDSLRGLSLRISVDASHKPNAADSAAAIMDALHRRPASDKQAPPRGNSSSRPMGFSPGTRQSLLVLAVDCYEEDGKPDLERLKEAIDLAMSTAGDGAGGRTGFVLSTGMTIPEAADALRACGVDPAAFDAMVCSSGAEICYPWKELAANEEYAGHVAFRWPGESL